MPKPTISAVTLVVHTPRRRIIRMSTSGCGTCSSKRAQPTSTITPNAIRPSTRADPHPQLLPSLTASSTELRPTDISAAPPQSILAGVLIGDSGTKRCVQMTAPMITRRLSQKIHV
jgi:hypothetical protein